MSHPQTGVVQPMGAIVETGVPLTVRASVLSTAPLEALLLYRGQEPIHLVQPSAFDNLAASKRIRVSWRGSRRRGRGRRVAWDGTVRVNGTRIVAAETVAFDALSDGLRHQTADEVTFVSSTTGDMDGLNLDLAQTQRGILIFDSKAGQCIVTHRRPLLHRYDGDDEGGFGWLPGFVSLTTTDAVR